MKYSKQIKTGVLVIIGIFCFVVGFNFLKSRNIFSNDNRFYARFDHSGGLKAGTSVTVNGFKVGNVEKVAIEDNTGKILVTFTADKDFRFSKKSVAELYSSLLGSTALQIVPKFNDGPDAESGDTLPSRIQVGMIESLTDRIEPTQDKLNTLLSTSDTVLGSISRVLDKKGEEHLRKSLEELNATLANFNKISAQMNQMIYQNRENLNTTLSNMTIVSQNLAQLTDTLKKANLDEMLKKANHTMANVDKVIADIQSGKGSMGLLMSDESLYKNLDKSSKQLELLLQDFRLNPKRYVHFSIFGKKQKNYVTPEEAEKAVTED